MCCGTSASTSAMARRKSEVKQRKTVRYSARKRTKLRKKHQPDYAWGQPHRQVKTRLDLVRTHPHSWCLPTICARTHPHSSSPTKPLGSTPHSGRTHAFSSFSCMSHSSALTGRAMVESHSSALIRTHLRPRYPRRTSGDLCLTRRPLQRTQLLPRPREASLRHINPCQRAIHACGLRQFTGQISQACCRYAA